MPNFQNPAGFFLLLLIPLFFLLRKLKIFNQISFTAVLGDWQGRTFEWKGKAHKFFSILSTVFLAFGFILCVTAFADPVFSHREKVYSSLGTDIIFVLDTSPSMAAKDVNGLTRLAAAKNTITALSAEQEGFRFGIVALGSEASVVVPPTSDRTIFNSRTEDIQVGIMGNGSAIGDGISTAVCHLMSSSAPKKCIILLTDGESNAGQIHPETAAKIASENEITLYVVGIGSRGNVPIEYTDPLTGKNYTGYLDSDFNPASLRKIAGIAGGRYFEVKTVSELSSTLSIVAKTESVSQSFYYRTVNELYYQKLLTASIIFLLLAWIIKRIILREMICYKFKKILYLRSLFVGIAFIMLFLAHAGLSWGTYFVPVQKSGSAVSFVFDISNSMLANDGPEGMSRLKAAKLYAKKLLEKMEFVNTSVVLAKGDGIAAIPLTEDSAIIESLLDVMSPNLMTAPGTSLGKGILKAKETFPQNYSSAGRIWVFTDGEETDNQLTAALGECIKSGIPVTIIGFGRETESDVIAGDGKTRVKSALRSKSIQSSIEEASAKMNIFKNKTQINFVNSTERGSAAMLLSQLSSHSESITSYEAKPIPRYKLFVIFAILSFTFSFIFTEVDFKQIGKKLKASSLAGLLIIGGSGLFSGCSGNTAKILDGTYSWHKKQYRHSISQFMEVAENASEESNNQILAYSLYDLGTAYSMLDENEAAMERFAAIPEDSPDQVKFAAYYNAGIIQHKKANYEEAQDFFRKALEIDNTKINAKINMELSLQMAEASARQNESKATPASDEKSDMEDMENAVFQHIKENDKKQWKNSESNQQENLENDY